MKAINKEIFGIQILKGIAAFLVVLNHTTTMAVFPKYFGRNILDGFFLAGCIGVEIFLSLVGL